MPTSQKTLHHKWLERQKLRVKSSTFESYVKALHDFDTFCLDSKGFPCTDHIIKYLAKCQERWEAKTVATRVQIWRKLCTWLCLRQACDPDVLDVLTAPKVPDRLPTCLSADQVRQLLVQVAKRCPGLWPMILCSVLAGLRPREARELHRHELCLEPPEIWSDYAPYGFIYLQEEPGRVLKNSRASRLIPIPATLRDALEPLSNRLGLLFAPNKPQRRYSDLIRSFVKVDDGRGNKVRASGLQLRHTFATAVHAARVPSDQIALYMGHRTDNVTYGYYLSREALEIPGLEPELYLNPLPTLWRQEAHACIEQWRERWAA